MCYALNVAPLGHGFIVLIPAKTGRLGAVSSFPFLCVMSLVAWGNDSGNGEEWNKMCRAMHIELVKFCKSFEQKHNN